MEKRKFRICIEPNDFLNRVCTNSSLERLLENINYIISPRDLTKIVRTENIDIILMRKDWMESIIKSIRYLDGEEAYDSCEIKIGRIDPNILWYVQTFVQNSKLISLGNLVKLLKGYTITGFSKIGGLILMGKGEDKNIYMAFYIPPIVEVWDAKDLIAVILDKIEELEEEITLPGYFGDTKIYPRNIIRGALRRLEKMNSIYWLRDGTHRAYITSLAGTTMQVVIVNGKIPRSAALPVPSIDYLVVTREKPKEKRHRFLGFDPRGWMDYHGVGIDG